MGKGLDHFNHLLDKAERFVFELENQYQELSEKQSELNALKVKRHQLMTALVNIEEKKVFLEERLETIHQRADNLLKTIEVVIEPASDNESTN